MPDSYYPEDDNPGSGETTASKGDSQSADAENTDDKSTALLPKSFFEGKELEPGSTCKIRIEHVYDDEVGVSYVPHEKGESKEKEDREEGMDMSGLESMASESE